MLIKHRDEAAVPGNVAGPSADDRSVASGRTLDEIAAGKGRRAKPFMTASGSEAGAVWQSNRNDRQAARSPRVAASIKSPRAEPKRKTAGSLPPFIEPQLAKSVAKPPPAARNSTSR
jgi:bifunctional non-homologous end joining protein LigD